MATVFDVADYILGSCGDMTTMKLQKLVYYSQAWSLVWDDEPLFDEKIEAWVNGPVVPSLFAAHKGQFKICRGGLGRGDASHLTQPQRDTVDAVIRAYGDYTGAQLSEMTHRESPWVDARRGLDPLEESDRTISLDAIADYYTAVYASSQE